jgi:hypothetical protein
MFPLKSSCFNTTSKSTLNKVAARVSPWFTPDFTLNASVYSLFILTLALVLIRVNSVSLINFTGTLSCAEHYVVLFLYIVKSEHIVNKYIMHIYVMFIALFKNLFNYEFLSVVDLFG